MTTLDIAIDQDTRRELPRGWRWVRLGEVCRVVSGSTPSSTVKEFWDGDIVWITPTDLGQLEGRDIFTSQRRITLTGYDNSGTELVPPDAVVMSSRAPIGHLGIARVPLCTNQGCKSFVPSSAVDPAFLYFALKRAVPELKALGSGATFAEVSKSQLEQFEISLPPLLEQRRIAAILAEQLTAVERARAAAVERLEAARALPAAYLRAVFESEEAQRWPRTHVDKISSLVIDGPHVTPSYVSRGIPFLTVRNIVNRRIDLSEVSYVSPSDHSEFAKRGKAGPGDILYTKDGTLGIPCVVDIDADFSFFVSVALIKLIKDTADPYYVAFALESPHVLQQVERLGAGAGLKHMVLKSIRALEVPLPDLDEQRCVAALLSKQMRTTERVRAALQAQLAAIDKLPAALLRRAFNGEL